MTIRTEDPFRLPKAKLRRATDLISELQAEISVFLGAGKHRLGFATNDITGQTIPVIEVFEHLPENWSLILGDAIHNMRSALDILACNLATLAGKSHAKVYFPFGSNETSFEENLKKSRLRRAGEEVVAVVRALKPYGDGNRLLMGLHQLDIRNKHETILLVSQAAWLTVAEGAAAANFPIRIETQDGKEYYGASKVWVRIHTTFDLSNTSEEPTPWPQGEADGSVFITFSRIQPFSEDNLLRTLNEIHRAVTDAIAQFEALYV